MTEFHPREITVQAQLGLREQAERLSRGIGKIIQPKAQEFMAARRFAIASSLDREHNVWASLLFGSRGFIRATGETEIVMTPDGSSNGFDNHLADNSNLGILTIDFAHRRRLRINGTAELQVSNEIKIQTEQIFFNCPKYIVRRSLASDAITSRASETTVSHTLNQTQQDWINQADTFFIASCHPDKGADTSHRGGKPGFIQIVNHNKLIFPDYTGNNLFQTFGNLVVNPNAGLLFIDFAWGNTLQLIGQTEILWQTDLLTKFPGAKRLVEFQIKAIAETKYAIPLRWH